MTQEMEALAFEGSQGVELTDEEAEESARAYDEAQVLLKTEHDRICGKPHHQNDIAHLSYYTNANGLLLVVYSKLGSANTPPDGQGAVVLPKGASRPVKRG